jgi:hypothetical protein
MMERGNIVFRSASSTLDDFRDSIPSYVELDGQYHSRNCSTDCSATEEYPFGKHFVKQ